MTARAGGRGGLGAGAPEIPFMGRRAQFEQSGGWSAVDTARRGGAQASCHQVTQGQQYRDFLLAFKIRSSPDANNCFQKKHTVLHRNMLKMANLVRLFANYTKLVGIEGRRTEIAE